MDYYYLFDKDWYENDEKTIRFINSSCLPDSKISPVLKMEIRLTIFAEAEENGIKT
ncbi:hypothetical protein RST01_23240 [Rummeliibacillus stabekisii]|nr:hypothetical protein RST01_23240 [Rummeliibacillus stabekisii]